MRLRDVVRWLDDRVGENVTVEIAAETGAGEGVLVLSDAGPLGRWQAAVDLEEQQESGSVMFGLHWDAPGLYTVGDAVLNVTRLVEFGANRLPGDGLIFELGAGVRLRIVPAPAGR